MELRLLRYFQAVAEELSFSKAARRLRVAQPALSRAVKELENQLGAAIFARSRQGVTLTAAGAVLLDETAAVLQRVDHLTGRVRRTAMGEEGELRIGFIGAPTHAFLGRLLREYHARFPRVSIVLEERTPERVWEMVARGRLTVGLTRPVLATPAEHLRTILLRREPLCGVFPETDPRATKPAVQWRELADDPLIILARREGVGLHETILAACRRAKFSPRLAHTPSVITTVLSYVEAGAGIGIIPESVAMLGAGTALAFRALIPERSVELVMVWNEGEASPPLEAFRTLVTEWLQARKLWK
jgi:LysR family transcriptional regulator, benzoate and cis,cis-muconate-responsive activator of ben and cat genes